MVDAPRACAESADDLAEVALGLRDPAEVPGLEAHLTVCASCRAELVELTAASDRLLLLAPTVVPPSGVEERAVAAMTGQDRPGSADAVASSVPAAAHRPRRRRLRTAALVGATAIVLAAVLGVGIVLVGPEDPTSGDVAAALVSDDGSTVGRVELAGARPRTMTVALDGVTTGVRYRCDLVLADGSRHEVGTWTVWSDDDSWTVSIPGAPADRVELVGADGTTAAVAELPE